MRPLNALDQSLLMHSEDQLVNLITSVLSHIGLEILDNVRCPSLTFTVQLMDYLQFNAANAFLVTLRSASEGRC
jgi:hypothetical protein